MDLFETPPTIANPLIIELMPNVSTVVDFRRADFGVKSNSHAAYGISFYASDIARWMVDESINRPYVGFMLRPNDQRIAIRMEWYKQHVMYFFTELIGVTVTLSLELVAPTYFGESDK